MKAELHIPTEQYGFVSVEVEVEHVKDALALYASTKETAGVTEKEMNYVADMMLLGEGVPNGLEIYEKMNPTQVYAVQWLKRALKRSKSRTAKAEQDHSLPAITN